MSVYERIQDGFDFDTKFQTCILAFCPDTDSWFVTNERFFYYEYPMCYKTKTLASPILSSIQTCF